MTKGDRNVSTKITAVRLSTTDFFSNYISQSYNEYYQSCIQFAQTFEEKDRLELQFITPDGRMVASSYGEFAGKSPQTPDIQEAVTTGKLARYQGRDPDTHENRYPRLELLRLAIPRRVYSDNHIRVIAAACRNIYERRAEITTGYRITFEAPILRHFTVELDKI